MLMPESVELIEPFIQLDISQQKTLDLIGQLLDENVIPIFMKGEFEYGPETFSAVAELIIYKFESKRVKQIHLAFFEGTQLKGIITKTRWWLLLIKLQSHVIRPSSLVRDRF